MKTFKIHLIRHGITDANLRGAYIGNRTDLPLCPEGVAELRAVREAKEYPSIEKLYSSPMLRARQSAAIIYPGYEVNPIDSLTEYDFGDFEGKTARELEINPQYFEWTSGKVSAPSGGEDSKDFIKRLALGLNEIVLDMMKEEITSAAVIMHGGAIMMLLSACAVPRKAAVEWTSEVGGGYSIRITPSLYHSSGIVEAFDII